MENILTLTIDYDTQERIFSLGRRQLRMFSISTIDYDTQERIFSVGRR